MRNQYMLYDSVANLMAPRPHFFPLHVYCYDVTFVPLY